jgi:hypothetical protein
VADPTDRQTDQDQSGDYVIGGFIQAGRLAFEDIGENILDVAARSYNTARGPQHVSLQSSAIASADYNPATKDLDITFVQGGTYTFYGVPRDVFVGLINAPSAGGYYNARIRYQFGA